MFLFFFCFGVPFSVIVFCYAQLLFMMKAVCASYTEEEILRMSCYMITWALFMTGKQYIENNVVTEVFWESLLSYSSTYLVTIQGLT
jgi:hypothetical protein